jgi:TolB-like protein
MPSRRVRRTALGFVLGGCCAGVFARPALAQCPDGSLPPCVRPAQAPRPGSVAVAYFAVRDTADAYLADGLTEDLTALLARSPGVLVKPSSSVRVAQRRQPDASPRLLGRALNVRYVVQATLRRTGERVRLTVQVVETGADVSVWGETYDRTPEGLLDLPGELADEVARRVSGSVPGPAVAARPAALPPAGPPMPTRALPAPTAAIWRTRNPDALDHFRRGNYLLATRSREAEAVSEYREAARLDPAFAAAVAREAYALALLRNRVNEGVGASATADSLVREGVALAETALRYDSTCSDAWMALGYLRALGDPHGLVGADEAFQRAVALDPANAEAWHQYGQILNWLGDHSAAVRALERALSLEPARAISLHDLAFYVYRDAPRALALLDSAVALHTGHLFTHFTRGSLLLQLHRPADALRDADTIASRAPEAPSAAVLHTGAYAMLGDTARARQEGRRFLRPRADGGFWGAFANLALGDTAWALEHLEHIPVGERGAMLWSILHLPEFDALRGNARFERVYQAARPAAARAP